MKPDSSTLRLARVLGYDRGEDRIDRDRRRRSIGRSPERQSPETHLIDDIVRAFAALVRKKVDQRRV